MNASERARLQECMCRLVDGDRVAFTEVFALAWPVLRRFAARMLGEGPEADDATQQAMLKVFAQAVDFDPDRDALSWMLALTVFECRTLRRSRSRRRETAEVPEVASAFTPETELMETQLMACAREAVGELRPEDLEALEAARSGRAPEAVAPGTFRKRVQRAIARLRIALRLKHGD